MRTGSEPARGRRRRRALRHKAARIAAGAVTLGATVAAVALATGSSRAAVGAVGATVATIEPSFRPNRPGASTALTVKERFAGPEAEGGIPSPLRKEVLHLPLGVAESLAWPVTRGCSRAHLLKHGARGCPARSQIGTGSAKVAWRENGTVVTETARMWAFVAPTSGEYAIEVLGEGTHPVHKRVVVTESLFAQGPPYSGGMTIPVPAITIRPGGPEVSLLEASLTVGPKRGAHGLGIRVPRCPSGGYPWAAEITFANGSTQELQTTTPCG